MRYFFVLFITTWSLAILGQGRCGVDESYFNLNRYQSATFENWLFDQKLNRTSQRSSNVTVYQIPVVVHIIHNGEEIGQERNLSDERVIRQILTMNQDFRRNNADTSLTASEFLNVAADTRIEFVLAKRDPEGLPTNGIVRVQGSQSGYRYSSNINQSDEYLLKSESQWPTDQYLNIYVADLLNGFIGYAQFPFVALEGIEEPNPTSILDGVVVDYQYFGDNPDTGSFESFGRTLTHEVGHYLGLRHIWGDNSICGQDDFCDDTPEQSSSYNQQCPSAETTSCNTSDMYSNYLNYTNDACMNIFTSCQMDRMRTVIENSPRVNVLLRSPALKNPIIVANDLGIKRLISPNLGNCSNEIYPVIELRNYGTNTISSGQVSLYLNNQLLQEEIISSELLPLETIILNFDPFSEIAGTVSNLEFRVDSVNGETDENEENNTESIQIEPTDIQVLPYENSFNDVSDLVLKPDTLPTNYQWDITNAPYATGGNQAAVLRLSSQEYIGQQSILLTPTFDLSSLSAAELSFSYSYAGGEALNTFDGLSLYYSVDCGNTFVVSDPLFQLFGNALTTSSSSPAVPNDWERISLNLTVLANEYEQVRFAFAGLHGAGGTIYLDSISFSSASLKAIDIGINQAENIPLVSCFSSLVPAIEIKNYGFETINSFRLNYTLEDQSDQLSIEDISLSPGDQYTVTIPFSRLSDGKKQLAIELVSPNDTIDESPSNNIQIFEFVIDGQIESTPTRLDFEDSINWFIASQNDTSIWKVFDDGQNKSLKANAFASETVGSQHWLISPMLDLTDYDSASVVFEYAYQGRSGRSDRLQILLSQNCGNAFQTTLFDASSNDLSAITSTLAYQPSGEDDWKEVFLDLSRYTGSDQIRLAFVFENGNGNNLYLDNINIYQSSDQSILRFEDDVKVYPNPAQDRINLALNLSNRQAIEVQLADMSGKIVRRKSIEFALNQNIIVETEGLSGFYVIRIVGKNINQTQRIIVSR